MLSTLLVACGGGASLSAGSSTEITISGTVAIGKAIEGASVIAKCQAGTGTSNTVADGTYRLTVQGGLFPCVLQEANQVDGTKLHSVITGTGSATTVNITPLTEMVAARVLGNEPAVFFAAFDAATAARSVTTAAVNAAQVDVVTILTGVADASAFRDFISTPLTAATLSNPAGGDDQDKLLDTIRPYLGETQLAAIVKALANTANVADVKIMVDGYVLASRSKLTPVINPATNTVRIEWDDTFPLGTDYIVEFGNIDGTFTTLQTLQGLGGAGSLMQWQSTDPLVGVYRVQAVSAGRSFALSTQQGQNILNIALVAKWLGNANSALSFIWDDNNSVHYDVIGPLFERYGFRASFALITYSLARFPDNKDIAGYKSLLAKGHELSSHTVHHVRISDPNVTEAIARDELSVSKQNIIDIFGVIPKTFIHPGNGLNPNFDVVPDYYLYSRINNPHQDPENFVANISSATKLARLNYIYSLNAQKKNWVTIAGHGVDGIGYEPISSQDLDNFLNSLRDQPVWVDTYSNVALYNEIRLAVSSLNVYERQIVIDDSKIDYQKFAAFGISSIPLTIIVDARSQKNFIGSNILDVKHIGQQYLVTVNLVDSNIINWVPIGL